MRPPASFRPHGGRGGFRDLGRPPYSTRQPLDALEPPPNDAYGNPRRLPYPQDAAIEDGELPMEEI